MIDQARAYINYLRNFTPNPSANQKLQELVAIARQKKDEVIDPVVQQAQKLRQVYDDYKKNFSIGQGIKDLPANIGLVGEQLPKTLSSTQSAFSPLETAIASQIAGVTPLEGVNQGLDIGTALEGRGVPSAMALPVGLVAGLAIPGAGELGTGKKIVSKLAGAADNIDDTLKPLLNEAKKYKSAEEFVMAQGTPVYHGGAGVDELNKSVKILSPEEKLKYPSSGGGYVGLSTTADKSYAQQYSKNIAGREDVAELFVSPKARVKKIVGNIDDFSANEITALSKKYDVLKSVDDNEFRILNANAVKSKSQLTDIWNKANGQLKK